MTLWDLLYGALHLALIPLARKNPRLKASLAVRKGFPPPSLAPGKRAWIHGASVGEILSVSPVLDLLKSAHWEAALSCNTPTGLEAASRAFPGLPAFAMPLDFSGRIRTAFDDIKPSLLILMELELWPQLLAEAQRRNIPILCVNARITEKSSGNYRRLWLLLGPSFRRVALWLPQGEEHANRLRELGVATDRIRTIPNLKALTSPPPRPEWIPRKDGSPVLVAGSTHADEEEAVLDAMRGLPDWRLVLAPRHPERFDEVAGILKARNLAFSLRSAGEGGAWRILLLDTLGELGAAYAAADLAFVGGGLAPVGGHNVFEPARCGVGVLVGPHTAHVDADVRSLEAAGGLLRVPNAAGLAGALSTLGRDEGRRRAMGEAARRRASGDGKRLLTEALLPYLG